MRRSAFQMFSFALLTGVALSAAQAPPARVPSTNGTASLPPLPPSPIAYFRELLALDPARRQESLASKPEPQRRVLLAKLDEYASLSAGDRDARLAATEMRWYLRPLMDVARERRGSLLDQVPAQYRDSIHDRLNQWDELAATLKREPSANEAVIAYFLKLATGIVPNVPPPAPPVPQPRVEVAMERWTSLSPEKRQETCDRFHEYFNLPDHERQRMLDSFTEAERDRMEKTLRAFAQLSPAQRRMCVNSFSRFAGMTPAERATFLKSAEQWREMSPAERQSWRSLVEQLPPLPPGFGNPPLPRPPRRELPLPQPAQ